jgi:hypothetical protein
MAQQLGSSALIVPYVADHRYSSLHQERSYLLLALATEESRAEHLSRCLETITTKLKTVEAHEDSTDAVGNLRKAAAAMNRKLRKCYRSERAMVNNLAAVTACMQMLEQHQWRKAQFDYSKRIQQMPVFGTGQGLHELTLAPLIPPAYSYPCTPCPPSSFAMSPLTPTYPSMPATPMLQPQTLPSMENVWNAPMSTPYYEQFQMPLDTSTPYNTPQPGMHALWQPVGFHPSPQTTYKEPLKQARTLSLPNSPTTSWHTSGILTGTGEEIVASQSIELEKSSLIDGTSEALRMQRNSK